MKLSCFTSSPPRYVLVCILTSFGGFLFGMDTSIIGPVTVMKDYVAQFGEQSAIVHGAIVSSILIPAALSSSLLAGYVADLLGRPKCIGIGALIFGTGAAMEAGSVDLAMFVVGRCIEGLGEGLFLGNLVVYICEITPPSKRGPFTTGPQLSLTFGLLTGYFACYGTAQLQSSLSWRTPFILLASLSLLFSLSSFLFLVPSPRWLTLEGHPSEAAAAWDTLQVEEEDRQKVEAEQNEEVGAQYPQRSGISVAAAGSQEKASRLRRSRSKIFDLFSADVRARTALAVFIMGMQQLSGIDGVLYYAPLIFQQAGISSNEASFLASGVSAIVIVAVTMPATIFADKWRRRTSMISGGVGMGLVMLLIGILYATGSVHGHKGGARWVVIVAVFIYLVIFCITWSISCKVYAAEVQAQRTRAAATNLAHGSNWIANFLVALTTPELLSRSSSGAYFLWAGCLLLTAAICMLFMVETMGRSLDDIEADFQAESIEKRARRKVGGWLVWWQRDIRSPRKK